MSGLLQLLRIALTVCWLGLPLLGAAQASDAPAVAAAPLQGLWPRFAS